MKSKWKTAFWVLLATFCFTTITLGYVILEQNSSIYHLKRQHQSTEWDLEQFSEAIEGKLKFEDFKKITDRFYDLDDSTSIGLNRVTIFFDKDKKIKSVTTKW